MKTEKENREIRILQLLSDWDTLKQVRGTLVKQMNLTSPGSIVQLIDERIEDIKLSIEEEKEAIMNLSV